MKKYVLSMLLALCLIAALLPGTPAAAEDGHGTNHTCLCGLVNCNKTGTGHEKIPNGTTWVGVNKEYITNAGGYLGETGKTNYYYLTEDIVATNDEAAAIIKIRGNVVLCLNGHNIQFNNTKRDTGEIKISESNAGLTICDCDSASHKVEVNIGENYYNYAYYGGALINFRITASETGSKVDLYRCTIRNLYERRGNSAANIYSGVLNMYDGASILATSGSYAGGVEIKDCTFNMYGGLIAGNYKKGSDSSCTGGGVEVKNNATFNMYGGFIQDNLADNGGGVFVGGGSTFNMYGGKIQDNYTNGGGWQNHGGGVLIEGGTFNMEGGAITTNRTGTGNGGGIAMRGSGGVATLSGETVISGNMSFGAGGGIFVDSGNTLTIGDGVSIKGNRAYQCPTEGHQTPGRGGGIYSTGNLKINGGTISNNDAQDYGGGLAAGGTVNITSGTISSNEATVGGGGVFLAGTLNMSGGSISDNVIEKDDSTGAGVYVESGRFNFNGGSITRNKTEGKGAGVYVNSGVVTMTKDASISDNPGERGYYPVGGGVYMAGGTFDLNGGDISGNIYGYKGGGVYLAGGTFNLNSGSINVNSATDGAGVYLNGGTLNLKADGSINGNSCTNGSGGGLFCENGTVNVTGGKITGNSSLRGGGVFVWKGETIFNVSGNTSISDNKAGGKTNNVDLTQNGKITITGALTENANIGITANADTPFTSSWSTYMSGSDPVQFFTSDLDDRYVVLSGGEVELRNGYQIKFELNGGQFVSGYTPVYSYVSGNQAITLPGENDITRPGYTFDGWYENEGLTGNPCTEIPSGSTGPKTYYAKWTATTYTVTFDANGGTIKGGYVTNYTCGQSAVLPTDVEKSGYTFAGWYDNDQFTGKAVTAISNTDYGDKIYYAKWTANTYTVTFNANGGSGEMQPQQFTCYTEQTLTQNSFTRVGYTFTGWNTEADGSGVSYSDKQEVENLTAEANGSVTLYAQWKVATYTVTLHLNGGKLADGVSNIIEYTCGNSIALPDSGEIIRSGYVFSGWYADEGFKDGPYTEISSTDEGNKEFYARWEKYNVPDPHDIIVDGNIPGGTIDTSLSNSSAGGKITVTAKPEAGWKLAYITVDGERIDGNTFVMPDHEVRVSAVFISGLPFIDVHIGDWFYDYVAYVYSNGLMDGTSATTFEPNANMTRAMVWAILARIDGETITGANWADDARTWAMRSGVSDGTDPNGLVTREQFATMLYRYAVAKDYDVSIGEDTNILSYSDATKVSEWAIPAMQWACGSGIITGVSDSTLVPQGNATRAQCAAMLMRFAEA